MHVTPLRDRILVRRLEEDEQNVGGIITPDSAKGEENDKDEEEKEENHEEVIRRLGGIGARRQATVDRNEQPTSFRLTRLGAQPPDGSD
jgi:co-chaperonin GroES (HSP10)